MSGRIETGLFTKLAEAESQLAKIASRKDDPDSWNSEQNELDINGARDNLLTFTKNFLIQFFHYGYGVELTGMNPKSVAELKESLASLKQAQLQGAMGQATVFPMRTLAALNELLQSQRAIMADPYAEEVDDILHLYFQSLGQIFDAFETEGEMTIANYSDIMAGIDEARQARERIKELFV
jgi:hypothetical protein